MEKIREYRGLYHVLHGAISPMDGIGPEDINLKSLITRLQDERVQPLREVFGGYELLAYLSVRATQIGLKACEIPVTRAYPRKAKTPTKISPFRGNLNLFRILIRNARGRYRPQETGNRGNGTEKSA